MTTIYGLTGGVGMGKSSTTDCLRRLGLSVVDTDDLAKEIVRLGSPCFKELIKVFGKSILTQEGNLNRRALGDLVFSDSDQRKILESILHPVIREKWKGQVQKWKEMRLKIGIVVIPLLFETHAQDEFHAVVSVACTSATQMLRLSGRGWSREHCVERIQAQMTILEKMKRSDFVIWSEGTVACYEPQIREIF